jgi:hypothetical protein
VQTIIHGTERSCYEKYRSPKPPAGHDRKQGLDSLPGPPKLCVAPADNVMIRLRLVMSDRASTVKRPGNSSSSCGAQLTNGAGGKCLRIAAGRIWAAGAVR